MEGADLDPWQLRNSDLIQKLRQNAKEDAEDTPHRLLLAGKDMRAS